MPFALAEVDTAALALGEAAVEAEGEADVVAPLLLLVLEHPNSATIMRIAKIDAVVFFIFSLPFSFH